MAHKIQYEANLYKEIVSSMQEGIMVIGADGRIIMLNETAEYMLGLTDEDIGKPYADVFLATEGNDDFNEIILNTIYEKAKGQSAAVDFVRNGEKLNLVLTTSYIYNEGRMAVVAVMNDVTRLNELRDAQVALEAEKKANEAKSRFLSNMSHEIRTPINAVLGMNEMILREAQDSQILTYAANIQSSGKTLLFLINDILDLSKIESGKMEIIPANYEVSSVVMDLWNIIYLRAEEKNLKLYVDLDEKLPSVLYGDDVRIRQIVTNLLTNAVKYTPKGSVRLDIAYERQNDDGILLKISVKDTGMGIRQEDMGKLFESFRRIDEEKNRDIEGTGLGMNITMSLLKMMDGEMKVESEYGKGSAFTVIIPQKIISGEPAGSFQSIQEKRASRTNGGKGGFTAPEGRVLVVDDNAMNLTVFKALLKRTKLQAVAAGSGKQCLECVQEQKFHIIFMDHMMPEMDGIETLHEIKKLAADEGFPNRDTPVIALTANAVAGAKEMYLAEGFADFLTKPIDAEVMERMICGYLPQELVKTGGADENGPVKGGAADGYGVYLGQGVSVENGLRNAQGDMETYMELVRMFVKDKAKTGQLRQYISEHNMKDYAIHVHGLKGNARTLGAERLADIAYEHEMQSKAGNEDFVSANWDSLEKAWHDTLVTFGEIHEKYATVHEETDVPKDGTALELSQEQLDRVAALIDDFQSGEALGQINVWLKSPLAPGMRQRLKDAVSAVEFDFDDDKAIEILKNKEAI